MAINKVVFGSDTLMDITDSTVTEDTLLDGVVAYGADGERIVGRASPHGSEIDDVNVNMTEDFEGSNLHEAFSDLYRRVGVIETDIELALDAILGGNE